MALKKTFEFETNFLKKYFSENFIARDVTSNQTFIDIHG